MRSLLVLSLLTFTLISSAACTPRNGNGPPLAQTNAPLPVNVDPTATWPFWPTSMIVHPLTRYTTDHKTGRSLLEARLEFLDAQGVRTKAVGALTLTLADAAPSPDRTMTVHTWQRDLTNLAFNEQHFDEVTRMYVLRLEIDMDLAPAIGELRVEFESANNHNMQAGMRLKRPSV